MIENFNSVFLLIMHCLLVLLSGIYTIRSLFFPMTMVKEFNLGNNSIYIVRILGAFVSTFFLVGLYLIFRDVGPDGAWTYYSMFFVVGVVMLIYDAGFYFKLFDKNLDSKNSLIDIFIGVFTIVASVILISGLADKIY
mgnify:FL=1